MAAPRPAQGGASCKSQGYGGGGGTQCNLRPKIAAGAPGRGGLKGAKNNLQMEPTREQHALLQNTMHGALQRCTQVHDFAVPRQIAAFRINRYEVGMAYGSHLDNPLIGYTETLRSDISMTGS